MILAFEYGGIVFEEYRGRVGTVDFTDASKAYFFPVGVPGLFRQYNAPADFLASDAQDARFKIS